MVNGMEYNNLGQTNLKVSKLCFGTLSLGPLQANLDMATCTGLIREALDYGINFFDTAELYQTYDRLGAAIKEFGRQSFIISTKSYAYDEETAKRSLDKALTEMKTDYIDIFSLHEQESSHTIKGHTKALEYFQKMKSEGVIKAVGLSTHYIDAVNAGTDSPLIDVIHPIINISGLGIQDGTRLQMEQAIKKAYKAGKGLYAMKILGGGNLIDKAEECMDYILNFDYIHSAAIGMRTSEEIKINALRFNHEIIPNELQNKVNQTPRRLLINFWCEACGRCVEHCSHNALTLSNNKKVVVNEEKCVLCGYCGSWCPQLCIKII